MVKVGIIGATGYAGVELIRILLNHPRAKLAAVSSVSFEGKAVSEVYPSLYGLCDLVCCSAQEAIDKSEVVFACVQHGISQEFAARCAEKNVAFIDLGADFRLMEEADYAQWYGGHYTHQELHKQAVYALPELFRAEIQKARVLANPGCYPTSVALGLAPALREGLIEPQGIVIDSKSGVTGSGRSPSETAHFPNCNEAFSPYKIAAHRHTPEIEQTLSTVAGEKLKVVFVPHLLPLNRGIISTMYARLKAGVTEAQLREAYQKAYQAERFVRVLEAGKTANLRNVRCSNYCDVSLHIDSRTGTLIVVSALDNMVKGAAGQAVQNMNLLFSLPEDTGLHMIPTCF